MRKREKGAEVLSLLGLASRAGAVVKGTDATRRALRRGQARLVVLADDASDAQRVKVQALLSNQSVPYFALAPRASLGAAVGGPPLSAVAVTDVSFAEQLLRRNSSDADSAERR